MTPTGSTDGRTVTAAAALPYWESADETVALRAPSRARC
jgi:hypothetical protein